MLYEDWAFFRTQLANMDMVLAKASLAVASRYADLVEDEALRKKIFSEITREYDLTDEAPLRDHGAGPPARNRTRCSSARSTTAFPISTR